MIKGCTGAKTERYMSLGLNSAEGMYWSGGYGVRTPPIREPREWNQRFEVDRCPAKAARFFDKPRSYPGSLLQAFYVS